MQKKRLIVFTFLGIKFLSEKRHLLFNLIEVFVRFLISIAACKILTRKQALDRIYTLREKMSLLLNWMVVGLPLSVVVFLGINISGLKDNESGKILVGMFIS